MSFKKIKHSNAFLGSLFLPLFLLLSLVFTPASYAQPASACSAGGGALPTTIFLPWYHYLPGEDDPSGKCHPVFPKDSSGKADYVKGISLVALSVLDTLIRLSSLLAVGFLIYGAIQYITSQGEPNGLAAAKSTIANALIGLVIVMMAVAIVQFIGNSVR